MRLLGIVPLIIGLIWAQEESRTSRLPLVDKAYRIEGRIIDVKTGEGLPGALVRLQENAVYTDLQGRFNLPYTQSGDTLVVSLPEYRTKKVVITRPGSIVVGLEPFEVEVEAVEIVSEMNRETEAAVAVERLRSLEFSESYTSEQIMKRTTDFYTPNVLRRLPGVSILSGRFVSLRGLGERYNAVAFWAAYPSWLRYDASMPFVNELVSNLLGRMEIRKVWTPELLGHFGGGMIDFQFPESGEEGLQVALTGEIGTWGLGRRYPVVRGSWRPYENRDLPDAPTIQQSAPDDRPSPENFSYARLYRRLVVPDTAGFAPPGPLLTLSYAGSKGRARWALRAVYGQRYNRERIEFGNGQFGRDSVEGEWYYNQTLYGRADEFWRLSQTTGLAGSISFRLSERQILTFSCLGLNVRTQQYGLETGRWLYETIQDSAVYTYYWYSTSALEQSQWGIARLRWQSRTKNTNAQIESGFIGQHQAAPKLSAMSYAMYPGDSVLRYDFGLTGDYEAFWYSWHGHTIGLQSYIHPSLEWLPISGRDWLRIKVGLWYSWEQYRASSRILALMPDTTHPSIFSPEAISLTQIKNIYLPEYRVPGGFWILDRSTPFNNWYGTTHTGAGYAMMRMTVQRWEGMIGSRYEVYDRSLGHFAFGSLPARTFLRERTLDLLPSVILKYKAGETSHLRAAAYRTLIRPPVTSQVPVRYFGYVYAHFWTGDTLYRSSSVWNIDLRWERVRSQYRLFAIGLFYKALRNLPEIYLEPSSVTTVLVYKTRNRSYGEVGGVEVEMREVLWGDEVNPRLWGYFNVTLSESGSRFWKALEDPYNNRLQGQAPYVVNAGVVSRLSEKWEMGSFFNYTGPQIWIIGFDRTIYPHVVEGSRAFWEAQVSRRLGRWEVRLSVWDILNQPYRRLQRAGNLARASEDQIAVRSYQREEWRFYLTVRYRVF